MSLREPASLLTKSVTCGRSLTVNPSSMLFQISTVLTRRLPLTLIVTLLLIIVASAPLASAQKPPLASAQNAPPADKPVNTQVSPSVKTPQRRQNPAIRPDPKEAPKEAEPASDAVSIPVAALPAAAASPPASSPQTADDRLAFMAGDERGEGDSHEQPPTATGLLIRTLGALLLIVGLIVAAAWGMKRFGGARFGTAQENAPALAILNSLSLGERRSLTIVRFGDRTLLLGSTAQSVTLLAEAEADDFTPPARSVADILNDDNPAIFSQELFSATEHLDEQLETRRGVHSIS